MNRFMRAISYTQQMKKRTPYITVTNISTANSHEMATMLAVLVHNTKGHIQQAVDVWCRSKLPRFQWNGERVQRSAVYLCTIQRENLK